MENLPTVLSIAISFIDGHGISLGTAKLITWFGLILFCFLIVSAITQFIDAKKRPYHEWRIRVHLGKIRKIKINNSETNGKLRKIRNRSLKQLKHEMHLFSIHVRKRSEKDSHKMFNKYFFEIIGESLVCIENIANANRSLKVYFDTKHIDKYLHQISNIVRNHSSNVLKEHQSCYCEYTESIMTNFISLIDALEKSKLEDTKNEVNELIGVLKSYVYNFKHPY
jgi:hypothetical protein